MLRLRIGIALALVAATVALDQWTKLSIERGLGPGSSRSRVPLVETWFSLEYAQNRGVAFGLFGGAPWVATVSALAILVGVLAYGVSRAAATPWLAGGLGLTAGGAIGNLVDRLRLGYVVDFIAIGFWPNFNVADTAISAGVLLLALDALFPPNPSVPSAAVAASSAGDRHG